MPRIARLDIPGYLYHVYIRGIERRAIFLDDRDRSQFADRLSRLLVETGTSCLAWSFMTNHAHFLLKPKEMRLSCLMRRLLTGYAVWFNKRHTRAGHLFQNRYSSSICQEEPYLLELIRYVHLNPVRAGIVATLEALAHYPWSGHPVILGKRDFAGQERDDVLRLFGGGPSGPKRYLDFLAAGLGDETSASKLGPVLDRLGKGAINGDDEFTKEVRKAAKPDDQSILFDKPTLEEILAVVAGCMGMEAKDIAGRCRAGKAPKARALAAFLAVRTFGYNGSQAGLALGLGRAAVSLCLKEGEMLSQTVRGWDILLRR